MIRLLLADTYGATMRVTVPTTEARDHLAAELQPYRVRVLPDLDPPRPRPPGYYGQQAARALDRALDTDLTRSVQPGRLQTGPYRVTCPEHGAVPLTPTEYADQLQRKGAWTCPACGAAAVFDSANLETHLRQR